MKSSFAAHVVAERRSWELGEDARSLVRRRNSVYFFSSRSPVLEAKSAVEFVIYGEVIFVWNYWRVSVEI